MKLFLVPLFVACATLAFAQSNYHKGYIVKSNGDTVKGYIDYREWAITPLNVDFKTNLSDPQSQQFGPAEGRGFGVDGLTTFISYTGPISMDRNHFPDLPEKLDTSKIQANIFMKPLITGKYLSLYTQSDNRKVRYFVAEANTKPTELKYNYYLNEKHEAIERVYFRGQLIIYASKYAPGNSQIINDANTIPFDEQQLADIVYKINGDTTPVAKAQLSINPLRWFVGVGYASIKNSSNDGYFASKSFSSPNITFGFDHFNDPNVQQWVYRTGFSLSLVNGTLGQAHGGQSFTQLNASIGGLVIYNLYNTDNFKYYLGVGIAVGFSTNGIQMPSGSIGDAFAGNLQLQTGVAINRKWDIAFIMSPLTRISPSSYNLWANQSFGIGIKTFLDKY